MPHSYTHQLLADDVLPLAGGITRPNDFYFGAQGGDFMYFCRFFAMSRVSPGKLLHRERIYEKFSAILGCARSRPETTDYALGYVAHYAADTVFHPFVYRRAEDVGGTAFDRRITHTLVERDLDAYFLLRRGIKVHSFRLPYTRRDLDVATIAAVMNAALGEQGLVLPEKDIEKAIGGFFLFLRGTYGKSGIGRRVFGVLAKTRIKPFRLVHSLYSRPFCDVRSLNLERREWAFVGHKDIVRSDSADDLYVRALERSVQLIGVFRMCLESGHKLPRELFSLNFLTGLPEEYGDIDDAYGEGVDYSALLAEYLENEKRRK